MGKKYVVCSSYYINHYVDMESYHGDDAFRAAVINSYMDWYNELFYLFITEDKKSYGIIQRDLVDMSLDDNMPGLCDSDRDSDHDSDIESNKKNVNVVTVNHQLDYTTSKSIHGCIIIDNPSQFLKNQRIIDLILSMIDAGDFLVEKLCGWGWRQVLVFDGDSSPKKY